MKRNARLHGFTLRYMITNPRPNADSILNQPTENEPNGQINQKKNKQTNKKLILYTAEVQNIMESWFKELAKKGMVCMGGHGNPCTRGPRLQAGGGNLKQITSPPLVVERANTS